MEHVDPTIFRLAIFVLAIFVGYYVVWSVTPALHTLASVNIFGGFMVTRRMLAMYRKKERPPAPARAEAG